MEYFVNIKDGTIYKITPHGFQYKYISKGRKWENVSGLIDFSIYLKPLKDEEFALVWIQDYYNQTDKDDKKCPSVDFSKDDFNFYKNKETKDIIAIDEKKNAFLFKRKKIEFLGKDNSDLSNYEILSNVEAMDILDGRESGEYYLFTMDCYADENQDVHGYSEDGHHFVFQTHNYCLMYVDDKKPSPTFKRIMYPQSIIDNPPNNLRVYARIKKYYLKESKELPKYIHKVVDKYNNEHHTNVSYDLNFSINLWNVLVAEDVNHDFYECRPNSIIKLDKKKYPTLKQLGVCHNELVLDTIEMNAVRRADLAKGHITVFDICWTKRLPNGAYEGVTEDGRVFILNEDGDIELANRTFDVSTIIWDDNITLREVVQKQVQGCFIALLDSFVKSWNKTLKPLYIKIGSEYKFYGKPMGIKNKYGIFLKDNNGRLFEIQNSTEIFLTDDSVVMDDSWIEIPKYYASSTIFESLTTEVARSIVKEVLKQIEKDKSAKNK